jgi:hypothetical protein
MVAACLACAAEFAKWWHGSRWCATTARLLLGRHLATGSSQFVDYLERVTDVVGSAFSTALADIETQRNAPLDIVREKKRRAA